MTTWAIWSCTHPSYQNCNNTKKWLMWWIIVFWLLSTYLRMVSSIPWCCPTATLAVVLLALVASICNTNWSFGKLKLHLAIIHCQPLAKATKAEQNTSKVPTCCWSSASSVLHEMTIHSPTSMKAVKSVVIPPAMPFSLLQHFKMLHSVSLLRHHRDHS